jgi:uncharacterized protein YycO
MTAAVVAGTAMAGLLVAPAQAAETTASDPAATASSSGGDCKEKKTVGNARNRGDIFHSHAKTADWDHDHVGMYYTTKTIVEAPGAGSKSKAVTASTLKKCGPIVKMYVKAKQSSRDKAADYAYKHFRGKSYDLNFAGNKASSNDYLNCSELVWKAYKYAVDIELDKNGGPGVYPDDIRDDGSTVTYQTIR